MGAVIRRWVWLECIGVVVGGGVRRYIHFLILLIPTTLVVALFLACSSSFLVNRPVGVSTAAYTCT